MFESHVQATVIFSKKLNIHFRVQSRGHDYEGLSYVSEIETPFIVIDLAKLHGINVNIQDSISWIQASAMIGKIYYRISKKSSIHGFLARLCMSVGIGKHITEGVYGTIMRKYGLGAGNIVDAKIVDTNGRILDSDGMGEDLFWVTRRGRGGSFGIFLWWKMKLVLAPKTITQFLLFLKLWTKELLIRFFIDGNR